MQVVKTYTASKISDRVESQTWHGTADNSAEVIDTCIARGRTGAHIRGWDAIKISWSDGSSEIVTNWSPDQKTALNVPKI